MSTPEEIRKEAIAQVRKIKTSIEESLARDPGYQERHEEMKREMERIRSNPDNEKASQGAKAILTQYYRKDLPAFKKEVECAFTEIEDPGIARGLYLRLNHEIRRDEEKSFLREQARKASAVKRLASTEHPLPAQTDEEQSDSTRQKGKIAERWEDVHIELISEEEIAVRLAGKRRTYHYAQIGLRDGRTGKPVLAWVVLCGLAEVGEISWTTPWTPSLRKAMKKALQLLRKRLREVTGLSGDPFLPYRRKKGWIPRFVVIDRSYGGEGSSSAPEKGQI